MSISPKLLAGGLAGFGLLLSAGAALADPAQATASVNVRSGPGTGYGVVDTLYPGENVDVGNCRGSWCYIQHSGPAGWVSANYLDQGGGSYTPPPSYDDDTYYDAPTYYEPSPIYITPPPVYVRPPYHHFPHHPWPHPGNGNPPPHMPPGGGTPPWIHPGTPGQHPHQGFPFPGTGQPHFNNPGSSGMPAFHPQPHMRGPGAGGNICQTDPTACQQPGQRHH